MIEQIINFLLQAKYLLNSPKNKELVFGSKKYAQRIQ
jgi:hypothetical protein